MAPFGIIFYASLWHDRITSYTEDAEDSDYKEISKMLPISENVPWGTLLFTPWISLPEQVTPLIHRALYTNDIIIWTHSEYQEIVKIRMQEAVSRVEEWKKTGETKEEKINSKASHSLETSLYLKKVIC